MQDLQLMPVPQQPVQPGCNEDSLFASQQCRDAWDQYRDAVKGRNDTIQHNGLVQARLAGEAEARQAADRILQEHDSEIAALRSQVSALSAKEPQIFWRGAGSGASATLVLCVMAVIARRMLSKFKVTRRETQAETAQTR